MMTFGEEVKVRLKAKMREWDKAKEAVRAAKEHEATIRDQVAALQVLDYAERPKGKEAVATPPPVTPIDGNVADNKAEVVRLIIEEHAANGLAPAQIRKFLEAKKVQMPTNYLYAILLRAKKRGKIAEKDGKYYPKEKIAS
jgi:hypothetical protein